MFQTLDDKFLFSVAKRGVPPKGFSIESSSILAFCLSDKAGETTEGPPNENSVRAHYDIMTSRQAKSGF